MGLALITPLSGSFPWYALQVRTGGELRLRTTLETKGYETFLPTYVEVRRYSDRLKKIDTPLFPGYIFSRLDITKRLPILQTPDVHAIVSVCRVPQPLEESEIDAIRSVVTSGASALPWPYLQVGDRVVVTFGPLKGVEGFLIKVKDQDKLVLSVNLLQRSLAVEIDRTHIRPLTKR